MSRSRFHKMPFGAEVSEGDRTRFRLWAPTQDVVSVVLGPHQHRTGMVPVGDGFFEATLTAPPGTHYSFELADGTRVPDPASRHQPNDVHGSSEVIDPGEYAWQQSQWCGRPWSETVLYELHVGAFGDEGTFDGVRRKLDYLARLGVTAVELMPVGEFSGRRNWGYDGVLPFAPDAAYGRPEDLKRLVDEAHARALMVFLDVVYNHFGPDGNYLHRYAATFFDTAATTPWGPAINYGARAVRDFAIQNALFWLEEYQIDGLRLDAVDRIADEQYQSILTEVAETVRRAVAEERHVHLVLENDRNDASLLARDTRGRAVFYDAQWNDDLHHVCHVLATGERDTYYHDYTQAPHELLARSLSSGFVYQGQVSVFRNGLARGTPSGHLPPTAFVSFLQNHDQVGNRPLGDRITALANANAIKAIQAVLLLSPTIPMLFMGEEWGARQPFCFFTDLPTPLAIATRDGRRREAAIYPGFALEESRARIPDPNALSTFGASRLDWSVLAEGTHAEWLEFTRNLLRIRHHAVAPRLADIGWHTAQSALLSETALRVEWRLDDGARLTLLANLADRGTDVTLTVPTDEETLFTLPSGVVVTTGECHLPPWSVLWWLTPTNATAPL